MIKVQGERSSRHHCMVVHAYYPLGETRVAREAEALVNRGYKVDVICLRRPGEVSSESYRSVQIHRLSVKRRRGNLLGQFISYLQFLLYAFVKLTWLHQRSPYDIVQIHNLPDFLVFCALIPKLNGRPVILDLHDLMPEFYEGRFGAGGRSLFLQIVRWQEALACRFANHVITVSEHWRQALIQRGVPPEKCSVVMNVADMNIFKPPDDQSAHLPKDDEFRLIYHGSIPERYGLDLAIKAINEVRQEIPRVHLTIVGGGDHLPVLVQMVKDLGLQDHVTFLDGRLAEELPEVICTANIGIVPYRNDVFTDGLLPTKLMEYAALGLPAIAARTTSIQAYFSNTMVEFFNPGDMDDLVLCIRRLYNSPERLTELARKSQRFNERFNWSEVGAEYVRLVEQLIKQRGKDLGRK